MIEPQGVDTLWLLLCAGLAFLMQPGFMCLESGLTRSKNSIDVAVKNLADFGLSALLFWGFGYALMFGSTVGGWLGSSGFFTDFAGIGSGPTAFFVYQVMFCGTAVTTVSGAVAERMRFGGYLLTTLLLSGPIYTVFGHWVWNGADAGMPNGWLGQLGFRDFAGVSVVHSVGGWVALAAVLVLGPRHGRFTADGKPREIRGHNLPLAILGVFLLWLGWLGFNSGGFMGWHPRVPGVVANTMLAGAAGLVAALAVGVRWRGQPNVQLAMNGALAGLVSITGGCHAVSTLAAVVIGAVGGLVMVAATLWLERRGIDDVVGAVPVHAAAGVWGTLALALLGDLEVLGSGLGRVEQLAVQGLGAVVCCAWAFGGGYLGLRLIDRWVPLRVSEQEELRGLNVAEHGANTELLELVTAMERQAVSGDLSLRVEADTQTDVGVIGTQYNRVIGALQQAMQDLRDSADRYRRAIDHSLDAIITVNERGVILGWNPQAAAIFGWSSEAAIGQDVFELVTPESERESTRSGLLSFLTTGGESTYLDRRVEVLGKTRDGRHFPVEATFTMATYGERLEFHLCFQDITERQRTRRALRTAKEAAEAATRSKSQFLANMSHEIRTPMNGILGITALMLETPLSEQQRQYLGMVETSAVSLLRLLNDILDVSKIEAGKLEIEARDFELRAFLESFLGTLALQTEEKALKLELQVATEVPDALSGDPVRLGQILNNLVANGLKFTSAGAVEVAVGMKPIDEQQVLLCFAVSDSGPGIPPEKHHVIFRAFEQADSSTTRQFGGSGLGLAISKRLVEGMGGRMWVESQLGEGSVFHFTICCGLQPLTAGDVDTVATTRGTETVTVPSASVSPQEAPNRAGVLGRALVVEDNRVNQVVAVGLLAGWGIDCEVVSSGAEALEAIAEQTFDLVLLDMHMPDMDGFAVTAAIRAREPGEPYLPIIATTADVLRGDRQRCLDVGIDGYVPKPIEKTVLAEVLRSVALEVPRNESTDPAPATEMVTESGDGSGGVFEGQRLLSRAGNRQRAKMLIEIFLQDDLPKRLSALTEAIQANDHEAVVEASHALEGAAGTVCAPAVTHAAACLESAARSLEWAQVKAKYETLKLDIRKLTEILEAFCRS